MKHTLLAAILALATFISCSKEDGFDISGTVWEQVGNTHVWIAIYDKTATLHSYTESVQYNITKDYPEVRFTTYRSGKADLLGVLNSTNTLMELYNLSYTPKKKIGTFEQIDYSEYYQ